MSHTPKPLSQEEFDSIFVDTRQVDPVWQKHFYTPLLSVLEICGKKYHTGSRPQYYGDAREFATKLWECHDEADLKALVEAYEEGAAQFGYVIHVTGFAMLPTHREIPLGVEPLAEKPFSALAFRALEWLDDIEANNPGMTLPRL
jgi:hypothetical protein